MGRKRQTDRHLPERVYHKNGAYYYFATAAESTVTGKKWVRLGISMAEMYASLSKMHGDEPRKQLKTMRQLFDRYETEIISTKKPATQRSNLISLKFLRVYFDEMEIMAVESHHCFDYHNIRAEKSPISANRDIEVLSHSFSKAIEWGVMRNEAHPIRGLNIKKANNPRDRYVEDWEINAFQTVVSPFLQAYVELKILTGLSKSDLLSLTLDDLQGDGIHYQRKKTTGRGAKRKIILWTVDLVDAVTNVKNLHRPIQSNHLFCTRNGESYLKDDDTTSGFDSIWQRAMKKALDLEVIKERFTEHDLRAKAGSDVETLQHAQVLLDHTTQAMTDRVYRRKPVSVMPGKKRAAI
jgi:integrase